MTPITSDEQALLANLRSGVIYRPKRWSGDTHDDLGGSIDESDTHSLMQKAADAIERLAKTGPAVEGWLPIETAPRGEDVLFYTQQFGEVSLGFCPEDAPEGGAVCGMTATYPTHWRPLPEPPTAALEARG